MRRADISQGICRLYKWQFWWTKEYSRRNNLELKGVPAVEYENLEKVVETIASCLRVELSFHDLDIVHRVPTKANSAPNVVVKFLPRSVHDKVLKSAKKEQA